MTNDTYIRRVCADTWLTILELVNRYKSGKLPPNTLTIDDIREEAIANGVRELPATDDETPDAMHCKFRTHALDRINIIQADVDHEKQASDQKLTRQYSSITDTNFDEPLKKATYELEQNTIESQATLNALRERVQQAKDGVDIFKRNNKILRAPQYPESPIRAFTTTTALLLGETLTNATFFSATSEYGYIGGWADAFIISIIIIPSALLLGLFSRNINHIREQRRKRAVIVVSLYVVALLAFSFVVANYRISLEIDHENVGNILKERLLNQFFAITDSFDALCLFALNNICAGIAFWEGYAHIDDRYIGYGAVDRELRKAEEEYNTAMAESCSNAKYIGHEAEVEIDERFARFEHKINVSRRLINLTIHKVARAERHVAQIVQQYVFQIRFYRDENEKARSTPTPSYFSSDITINVVLGGDLSEFLEKKELIKQAVEGLQERANTTKDRLYRLTEAHVRAIRQHRTMPTASTTQSLPLSNKGEQS